MWKGRLFHRRRRATVNDGALRLVWVLDVAPGCLNFCQDTTTRKAWSPSSRGCVCYEQLYSPKYRRQKIVSFSLQLTPLACKSSLNVDRQVFFGRPLFLLPSKLSHSTRCRSPAYMSRDRSVQTYHRVIPSTCTVWTTMAFPSRNFVKFNVEICAVWCVLADWRRSFACYSRNSESALLTVIGEIVPQ